MLHLVMYFCVADKCSGLSFPSGRLAGGGESGRFGSADDAGRED